MYRYVGSSPHTRGTRGDPRRHPMGGRFIPAYAGNASHVSTRAGRRAVHPRIRGERHGILLRMGRPGGSSPHTRGTLQGGRKTRSSTRFIPAYAGNAWNPACVSSMRSVHPRIRGERWVTYLTASRAVGSSPHTRGTPTRASGRRGMRRFIPAYAGNAGGRVSRRDHAPVHPRIRGERWSMHVPPKPLTGSSPHTRGTRIHHLAAVNHGRFIPAYAGNALMHCVTHGSTPVHPRIRGERREPCHRDHEVSGSSPHTRGTHYMRRVDATNRRFIPAYAGNAGDRVSCSDQVAVHPRIRGERPRIARADACSAWFIPAYAGNAWIAASSFLLGPVHPRIRGERIGPARHDAAGLGSSPHTRGTHFQ